MSEKLKPCPFCGCEKIIIETQEYIRKDDIVVGYYYLCTKCGAMSITCDDDDDALKAWNARAYEQEVKE